MRVLLMGFLAALLLSGCASLGPKPWEKDLMARQEMQLDPIRCRRRRKSISISARKPPAADADLPAGAAVAIEEAPRRQDPPAPFADFRRPSRRQPADEGRSGAGAGCLWLWRGKPEQRFRPRHRLFATGCGAAGLSGSRRPGGGDRADIKSRHPWRGRAAAERRFGRRRDFRRDAQWRGAVGPAAEFSSRR